MSSDHGSAAYSLGLLWDATASLHLEAIAIRGPQGDVTYRSLAERVDARLERLGRVPRIAIGIDTDDPLAFVTDYLAVVKAGCIAVPYSSSGNGGPSKADLADLGISPLAVDGAPDPHNAGDWFGSQERGTLAEVTVLLFTSGTSGRPVGVLHTHRSLTWALWHLLDITDESLGTARPTPLDHELPSVIAARVGQPSLDLRFYAGMPFHTMAGLVVLHRAILTGESILALGGAFEPVRVLAALKADRARTLALSPHMARMLLRQHEWDPEPPIQLLGIGLGGGPVDPELARALEARFGCVVTIGYRATESGGAIAVTRPGDPPHLRHGTVGRCVASAEVDATLGTLRFCSRAGMAGRVIDGKVEPAGEWLDIGDVGELNDGYLTIGGRHDGVILRGGRRMDPVPIEMAIERHPGVIRAAVAPARSRLPGEIDCVALVLTDGTAPEESIRRTCIDLLPEGGRPQRYRIVDALPLTPDGGIKRHEIRAFFDDPDLL